MEMRTKEVPTVNEVEYYGYGRWLANRVGLTNVPQNRIRFQHMWIWWELESRDIPFSLDPALKSFSKELCQSEQIASVLSGFIESKAVGLPFTNFLWNEPRGDFQRNGKVLYVPSHSNPWCDFSKRVHETVKGYTKGNQDVTLLLAWNDQKLAANYGLPFEIGAGVWEITSFYRLRKIFSEYSYMLTSRMGSHVLYALACGMKVGLCANHWDDEIYHPHAIQHGLVDRAKEIRSLKYLDNLFPGIVVEGGLPSYDKCPEIMDTSPLEIARLLEWPVTVTD